MELLADLGGSGDQRHAPQLLIEGLCSVIAAHAGGGTIGSSLVFVDQYDPRDRRGRGTLDAESAILQIGPGGAWQALTAGRHQRRPLFDAFLHAGPLTASILFRDLLDVVLCHHRNEMIVDRFDFLIKGPLCVRSLGTVLEFIPPHQKDIQDRQLGNLHPPGQVRIVRHSCLRRTQMFQAIAHRLERQIIVRKDCLGHPQRRPRCITGIMKHVDVFPQVLRCCSEIAGQEFIDQFLAVQRWVPVQFTQHPTTQFREFRARSRPPRPLSEDPCNIVRSKKPDIRPKRPQIRMRADIAGKVDKVVPDIYAVGDTSPVFDTLFELPVLFVSVRLAIGTACRTDFDNNVRAYLGVLRRLLRPVIGKSHHRNTRKLRRHRIADRVSKVDVRARQAFFPVIHFLALGTFTIPRPVILRNPHPRCPRIVRPHVSFYVLYELLRHFLVGHAQLRPVPHAFAVHLTIPFRMLLEVFIRGQIVFEGMAWPGVHDLATIFRAQFRTAPIVLHTRRPGCVDPPAPIRLTILQRRHVTYVQLGYFQLRLIRDHTNRGCPPPTPDHVFKQRINRVKRPAWSPARDDHVPADRANNNALQTKAFGRQVGIGEFRRPHAHQQPPLQSAVVTDNLKTHTGNLLQKTPQFLRSVLLRRSGIIHDHDHTFGLTIRSNHRHVFTKTSPGQE